MNYDVNCTSCGRRTNAVNMAINIDELIEMYLKREKEKNKGNNICETMLDFLSNIRLGLYFSYFFLKEERYLGEEKELKLWGKDIICLLTEKYKVDLEGAYWKDPDEREEILDVLTDRMYTTEDVEVDWQSKRKEIKKTIDFLSANAESVFVQCKIEPRREKDDKGNDVTTGINAVFSQRDGNRDGIPLVCPECGAAFLPEAGKYYEEVILLMGSARTGKTVYLAALIDYLNGDNAKEQIFPLQIGPFTDKRGIFFQKNILNTYQKGKKIPKTNISNEEMVPLVSFLLNIRNEKIIIVTFVDMPGEAYVPEEEDQKKEPSFIANKRKISKNASAYIFCIAPEQIDMPIKEGEADKCQDSAQANIGDVCRNIKHMVSSNDEDVVNIPMAVVITKNDKLKDYDFYNPNEKYEDMIKDAQYFMVDKYRKITEEVMEYLQAPHVVPLEKELQFISKCFNYFTVASYGDSVETVGKNKKIPSGIILPFVWILTMLGYFKPAGLEFVPEKKGWFSSKHNLVELLKDYDKGELIRK